MSLIEPESYPVEDDEPTTPEWYEAAAYMPLELEQLWADAPVIPVPVLIETKVYQFSTLEVA